MNHHSDSRVTAPEAALLIGAAVAISSGLIVWLGAALSAALSGERLTGGLSDGVRAAFRLPEHLSEPRSAWPTPADRSVLPGPALYWFCTTVVLVGALLLLAVWAAIWVWRRTRERGRVRLGVETRARFATGPDLAPLVVERPVPAGRFVLGRVHGRLVATEDRQAAPATSKRVAARQGDRGSVAVIGPSRSGKTVNVIAGLLDWDGPAVVVSVKRDLIDATRERRDQLGETRVFDPSGVAGLPAHALVRWTPLRSAGTPRGAQKAATALAASIPRSGVDGGADYWVKQAEILLTGLLGAAALDPSRTMLDVAHWVFTNHLTKIVFSGASDAATLDYVSRLLGDEDVSHRSVSYDVGGGMRRSVSESTHREALTPFHLLRQVRPGEAVLIHGTLPPAHLKARRWWEEPPPKHAVEARAVPPQLL